MQLKQQILLPATSLRPQVVQSATRPVCELTSSRVVFVYSTKQRITDAGV